MKGYEIYMYIYIIILQNNNCFSEQTRFLKNLKLLTVLYKFDITASGGLWTSWAVV